MLSTITVSFSRCHVANISSVFRTLPIMQLFSPSLYLNICIRRLDFPVLRKTPPSINSVQRHESFSVCIFLLLLLLVHVIIIHASTFLGSIIWKILFLLLLFCLVTRRFHEVLWTVTWNHAMPVCYAENTNYILVNTKDHISISQIEKKLFRTIPIYLYICV